MATPRREVITDLDVPVSWTVNGDSTREVTIHLFVTMQPPKKSVALNLINSKLAPKNLFPTVNSDSSLLIAKSITNPKNHPHYPLSLCRSNATKHKFSEFKVARRLKQLINNSKNCDIESLLLFLMKLSSHFVLSILLGSTAASALQKRQVSLSAM